MPAWLVIVKEMGVNLRILVLGARQVPGLNAPEIGGHFGVRGFGGLGPRKGRLKMGPGCSMASSPGSSEQEGGKDLDGLSRMVKSRLQFKS